MPPSISKSLSFKKFHSGLYYFTTSYIQQHTHDTRLPDTAELNDCHTKNHTTKSKSKKQKILKQHRANNINKFGVLIFLNIQFKEGPKDLKTK